MNPGKFSGFAEFEPSGDRLSHSHFRPCCDYATVAHNLAMKRNDIVDAHIGGVVILHGRARREREGARDFQEFAQRSVCEPQSASKPWPAGLLRYRCRLVDGENLAAPVLNGSKMLIRPAACPVTFVLRLWRDRVSHGLGIPRADRATSRNATSGIKRRVNRTDA